MNDQSSTAAWHALSGAEVVKQLEVDRTQGLTSEQVAELQRKWGANALTPKEPTPLWVKFLAQFQQALVYILLLAAVVSALLGEFVDAFVIFIVTFVNAIIGFLQESKAEKALDALAKMMKTEANVRRNGARRRVAAAELVPGDIVLLDEFLRGFPEVYNGLLDILTARQVGDFVLPKVFFIGASNSVIAYDKALEDRLLNIPVQDLRRAPRALAQARQRFVEETGLHPQMVDSYEVTELFNVEVLPTYDMLDAFKNRKTMAVADLKGTSVRNLVGQVQLRYVQSTSLREVVQVNNRICINKKQLQYLLLLHGDAVDPKIPDELQKLVHARGLTPQQRTNLDLNIQLCELAEHKKRKDTADDAELFE